MATHGELASTHMPKKFAGQKWATRVSTAHECNVTSGQHCMLITETVCIFHSDWIDCRGTSRNFVCLQCYVTG